MTTMDEQASGGAQAVLRWILALHPELDDVDTETDLFESGLVQSLQLFQLLVAIERALGRRVDRSTLAADDLRSLARIEATFFTPANTEER